MLPDSKEWTMPSIHGVLLDVVTTASLLTLNLAPTADLVNQDGVPNQTIYFAVQNNDSVAGAVTTTLTVAGQHSTP